MSKSIGVYVPVFSLLRLAMSMSRHIVLKTTSCGFEYPVGGFTKPRQRGVTPVITFFAKSPLYTTAVELSEIKETTKSVRLIISTVFITYGIYIYIIYINTYSYKNCYVQSESDFAGNLILIKGSDL